MTTPQARPVEQEIADVLAEHDWRWATRDSKTGDGVRIACAAIGCDWTAERLDDNDNVWDRHRAHVAAAIAPIIAQDRAAAAVLRAAVEAVRDEWRVRASRLNPGLSQGHVDLCADDIDALLAAHPATDQPEVRDAE